jgi:hypothetical protein
LPASVLSVDARAAGEPGAAREATRTEITPFPLVGGSTDTGFGGGAMLSVAHFEPDHRPYQYRIEAVSVVMLRGGEDGVRTGFQDHYVLLNLPDLGGGKVVLDLRASYTREPHLGYYGIGNAARNDESAPGDYYRYEWIHPTVRGLAKMRVVERVRLLVGASFTHNELDIAEGSKLRDDRDGGSRTVRGLLRPFYSHEVVTFQYGAEYDSRDVEAAPTRGVVETLSLALSPGGTEGFPARWARLHPESRAFFRLGSDRVVLALRALGDFLIGEPPFYELGRIENTSAIGGPKGVRGVSGQRFHGKIKVMGSAELRASFVPFRFLGKENWFGGAAFVDGGRLWATYASHPELDGTALGLKMGFGGGPRLIAGKSFVVRADIAWSPVDSNVGAYLAAGQAF